MKIRIRDYALTLTDIMIYPAWEFALDEEEIEGQDERTVRPYRVKPPLNPDKTSFLVRASFILVDGSQMKGLIRPIPLHKSDFMSTIIPYDFHPTLVTNEGQVNFCHGAKKHNPETLEEIYQILGKQPGEVFPIRFKSDVEILNSVTEGTLEGLMYYDENTTDFFHLQAIDIIYINR